MVGCFKIPLQVAGNSLLVRGIGTVSVHPYDRGKGYMKFAMHKAIDDAVAEGADYMVLSGRNSGISIMGLINAQPSMNLS